ncbi:hypothetical protein FQ154_14120 [Paeniglutamicibacter gangotriensis]|uniref:Uncharacterized protein n=1 Tax=Paeniglutamicibacter gangotriensis TaxID=254787 RepID=A0A5B0ECC0_9MICC|nr:hypothetical protein [Paeniglutamicibacter gangotriensis]KAA0975330.1 hypothetical protein FQ154_14120 [Paeniglutamicibacter gangotriensis]
MNSSGRLGVPVFEFISGRTGEDSVEALAPLVSQMFTNNVQQYLSWSYFHLVGLDVLLSAKFSGIASAQKIEELISP